MVEIALIPETALTIEMVLTAETVIPTLITLEHHLHSPIEIVIQQQEAILKDNPEAIITNITEQTRHQVKATNDPQTAIHQATTLTEVAEEVCLAEAVVTEHLVEVECLVEAAECLAAVAVEDDNIVYKN